MIYIGIDNGTTGSVGIIEENDSTFFPVPVKRVQDYTKKKQYLHRIDIDKFCILLSGYESKEVILRIERPMLNPGRFKASISAMRAHEAMLIALEMLNYPYEYIDSKEWQKLLLPQGDKNKWELKRLSKMVGSRLFPHLREFFKDDADGILIAEYARRMYEK